MDDIGLRDKVERRLTIIGEAVLQYTRTNPIYPIREADRIISFRNLIVHQYDTIDNTVVWAILKEDLPQMKKHVEELLRK